MKRRLFMMGLVLSLVFSGCSYTVVPDEISQDTQNVENPFKENEGSNVIGEISHGPLEVNWSEEGDMLPFVYEGGEFSLKYHLAASGKADSIGFMLFLNGKPQPYRVDNKEELSYCHSLPMKDSIEQDIIFSFIPVAGNKGETLNLTVLSLYYPDFQPDMETTSSYGFYQGILQNQLPIEFHAEAPVSSMPEHLIVDAGVDIDIREEKYTKEFLEKELPANGVFDTTAVESSPYYTIAYDGKLKLDNLNISEKDTVTIQYKLVGPEGAKYNTIFYLDHQPISGDQIISYETTLTKGGIWVAEMTLDVSRLPDFSTFYVISVPSEENRDSMAVKTNSILFYKEK